MTSPTTTAQAPQVTHAQLRPMLIDAIEAQEPALIVGRPGIGKTELALDVAAQLDADLLLSHPVVEDPTTPAGLPFRATEDRADFLPFGVLYKAIHAERLTVWMLDDLGQAPPQTQAAYMQLLLSRACNGHRLSPHVRFIACTNRRADRAAVQTILEPVKTRFLGGIYELIVSAAEWSQWAIHHDQPLELVAFARYRPNLLEEWTASADIVTSAQPRTIAAAGRAYKRLTARGADDAQMFTRLAGIAGQAFATEFCAFCRVWRDLPDLDAALAHPNTAPIPPRDNIAARWAFATAIAARATRTTAPAIVTLADRLIQDDGAELGVLMVQSSLHHSGGPKGDFAQTRAYITHCTTHQALYV
ncbi:MAG TPA: ATP-binding protein [Phycisphaerae bacterium]|nr:ATP-binding protein [Phycisphaerae bacterium]